MRRCVCADGGERPLSFGRRSGRIEVEGSLIQEALGRVESSPDKAGTGQYCQMVWVRRTRQKGVTRVNQWLNLRNRGTGSNLVDVGRAAVRAERMHGEAIPGRLWTSAREITRKACGVLVVMLPEQSWAPTLLTATQ